MSEETSVFLTGSPIVLDIRTNVKVTVTKDESGAHIVVDGGKKVIFERKENKTIVRRLRKWF